MYFYLNVAFAMFCPGRDCVPDHHMEVSQGAKPQADIKGPPYKRGH